MADSKQLEAISNMRAFPKTGEEFSKTGDNVSVVGGGGMTYRQWLIGMAVASGKESHEAVAIADRTIEAIANPDASVGFHTIE